MGKELKFKFDPNQAHQTKAIENSILLFDCLPEYEVDYQLGDEIISNLPQDSGMEEEWLYNNLSRVQEENNIQTQMNLDWDDGLLLADIENGVDMWRYPVYTIEMETGTGKTYVYLRTINELKKNYGFRKFIIIVPSIAIYEGVKKAFEITKSHFQSLYGNENVHITPYSGNKPGKLRGYASSSFVEILVMTVDSFNKKSNNIYKPTEKLLGEMLPYEYIQQTRPILILDESQNYRSEKSREALRTLKPLFAFNYSATPIDKPNLIYQLTPLDAFKQNLVKKIEVLGVTEEYNLSKDQLNFEFKEERAGYGLAVDWTFEIIERGKSNMKTVRLRKNDDLGHKAGITEFEGVFVEEINRKDGKLMLSNGKEIDLNAPSKITLSKEEIFRVQIENAIKFHFRKQKEQLENGIKVLTLFFIDKVDNYVLEDGVIKKLFDKSYENLKNDYPYFKGWVAHEVREGYFAKRKNKDKTEEFVDTHIEDSDKTKKDRELEKEAYELIMKKKERLLSFDEKVCFIFAHSALKEGWDNPNVFQICTLNQTKSEMKKRQEIGRGMRLAVNQDGERVMGDDVNILTVIANESYNSYVTSLQTEYVESGDAAPPRPSNAGKVNAFRNDKVFNSKEFIDFWDKLCQRTDYTINFNKEEFVEACVNKLDTYQFPEPKIVISRGKFVMTEFKITLLSVSGKVCKIKVEKSDTDGSSYDSTQQYIVRSDLSKILRDDRLKGYKVVDIVDDGDQSKVIFGDTGEIRLNETFKFHSEKGQHTKPISVQESQTTYPVFNLIDRTIKETNLTRPTVLEIFKSLSKRTKNLIFKNPEGFANVFISIIKGLLSDHIAVNIEYNLKEGSLPFEKEELFPESQKFPQKELIDGSDWSIYDQVQIDSDVEKNFVEHRLNPDNKVVCYFKFPPKFKIKTPKLIGNYNPDWGIIRWNENKELKLELVRETKGNIDPNLLQFKHEKRKIDCAKNHFYAVGLCYRQITDQTEKYWEPDPYSIVKQEKMSIAAEDEPKYEKK